MIDIESIYHDNFYKLFIQAERLLKSKQEAEDVVSQAFLKLMTTEDVMTPGAYLRVAVRNACIDLLRKKGKMSLLNNNVETIQEDSYHIIDSIRADIYKAINQLPELKRRIMYRTQTGFSNAEICAEFHISDKSVRDHKYSSRLLLKKILKPLFTNNQ